MATHTEDDAAVEAIENRRARPVEEPDPGKEVI
jgi:hypothetical protein